MQFLSIFLAGESVTSPISLTFLLLESLKLGWIHFSTFWATIQRQGKQNALCSLRKGLVWSNAIWSCKWRKRGALFPFSPCRAEDRSQQASCPRGTLDLDFLGLSQLSSRPGSHLSYVAVCSNCSDVVHAQADILKVSLSSVFALEIIWALVFSAWFFQ